MSNETVQKDGERGRKLSNPNSVDANSVGIKRLTRPRAPSNSVARKCCACQAAASSRIEQKPPQKSLKKVSDIRRRRSSEAEDLSTTTTDIATSLVLQGPCRVESGTMATVSANASPAARQGGTSVAKQKEKGGQEIAQVSSSRLIRQRPAWPSSQTGAMTAVPWKICRKKAEGRIPDGHKVSTTEPGSHSPAVSSKEPTRKEPKGRSSRGHKTETKASTGKSKLSTTDTHSSTSRSDCSSDTRDLEHHIKWDGFGEDDYRVGQKCCLCDEDLGVASWEGDAHEIEFLKLPVVAFLRCGHFFHHHCLEVADSAGQEGDPPCVFCVSVMS